jgi:hypothetical protein
LVVLSDLLRRSRFYSFHIRTKYRESYDKPISTKRGIPRYWFTTAELRSAPDSIKLCNLQLGDDYTYYMSPNTNVTRICDWATTNFNPCIDQSFFLSFIHKLLFHKFSTKQLLLFPFVNVEPNLDDKIWNPAGQNFNMSNSWHELVLVKCICCRYNYQYNQF